VYVYHTNIELRYASIRNALRYQRTTEGMPSR
jgi:hypothetical protein